MPRPFRLWFTKLLKLQISRSLRSLVMTSDLSFVVLIGLERNTAEVFGHIEESLIAFVPLG